MHHALDRLHVVGLDVQRADALGSARSSRSELVDGVRRSSRSPRSRAARRRRSRRGSSRRRRGGRASRCAPPRRCSTRREQLAPSPCRERRSSTQRSADVRPSSGRGRRSARGRSRPAVRRPPRRARLRRRPSLDLRALDVRADPRAYGIGGQLRLEPLDERHEQIEVLGCGAADRSRADASVERGEQVVRRQVLERLEAARRAARSSASP